MKKALITGITGQDGGYLAALLLARGYAVCGTHRSGKPPDLWRLKELGVNGDPGLELRPYDLADVDSGVRLLEAVQPTEIYNFAAQSFIGTAQDDPLGIGQATGIGAANLLEAIRRASPQGRFYQASSSEMFGNARTAPQNEDTAFHPRNPYGVAKLYAHWMTVNYRENHGIFAASGILFNHESPLRGPHFLTRRVSDGLARIRLGLLDVLELGNLDARRDWGYANEYVEGIWRMLQAEAPDTYVLATGRAESVRNFVTLAGRVAGFELQWSGAGQNEVGTDRISGRELVRINPAYFRPAEAAPLVGDAAKARRELGWAPRTSLEDLCQLMVESDLRRNSQDRSN